MEADRVLRDSLSHAAERRVDGRWLRMVTLPRETVLRVQRRLPSGTSPGWLTEDVRTAAGLDAGSGDDQTTNRHVDVGIAESAGPATVT